MSLRVGIDIGSTTVKVVVLDEQNKLLFRSYERHFSKTRERALETLNSISDMLSGQRVKVTITGSAGLGVAGYLPKRMTAWAEKAFYGTCDKYLSKNPDGSLQLDGICLVAGLGGKDHRDGSLAYYFSEPVVCNDAKGVGPLVLAYTEMIARK